MINENYVIELYDQLSGIPTEGNPSLLPAIVHYL